MVAVVPTEVTPVVAILIMLPYFVATIWTIFYTHNKTKNESNNSESDGSGSKDVVELENNIIISHCDSSPR
jgi:hypothetical protein